MSDAPLIHTEIIRFLTLHETKQSLKITSKGVNQEYKELNNTIHEFLMTQPGNAAQINERYTIQLRAQTKTPSLNAPLIAEAYVGFHSSHGRAVTDKERDGFMLHLKALRKSKSKKDTSRDVNILVTQ